MCALPISQSFMEIVEFFIAFGKSDLDNFGYYNCATNSADFCLCIDNYDAGRRALSKMDSAQNTSGLESDFMNIATRKCRKRIFNDQIDKSDDNAAVPDPPQLSVELEGVISKCKFL